MRALAIFLLWPAGAGAQQAPKEPAASEDAVRRELEALRAREKWLEQRVFAAELRFLEAQAPPTVVSSPPSPDHAAPHFRFGRGSGFAFASADGATEVRLRVVLHFDGRTYLGDAPPSADTFLLRRVRPFIEGTLWNLVDFRLMPDFPQGQAYIQDAYVELHPWRWLRLRGGRFMVPIGLEWLQSDSTLALVERSLATDLVPYRDLGLMLWGEVAGGTLCYQLAILNGAPDSANGPDVEAESDKDYVGRIFVRPLRPTRIGELANLGFGAAGSYGNVRGTAAGSGLPTYHSTGQQAIFAYLNDPMGPVVAAGARWRVTPQMYFYIGPVGLLVEYVVSSQRVQRLETAADIQNRAWNLTASFVLTLEHAAYEGVIPQHPVDLRHKNFGAFELTGRYSELRLDPGAFPMYADPAVSVRSAHELAGSLNWYLTDYVRIMLSYEHTEFTGGAPNSNRLPEDAVLGRFQIAL